jgi:hypothetical protein
MEAVGTSLHIFVIWCLLGLVAALLFGAAVRGRGRDDD